ncbi:MAG: thioredoxin domain-containing protein [Chlamydiota bacterium]
MVKAILFASFFVFSSAFSFELLPKTYLVEVGRETAKTQIVEYFSLGCPRCLKLIKSDFKNIFYECIQKSDVCWTFHPDPIDLTTLRFMICLENIPPKNRFPFFWEAVQAVKPGAHQRNTLILNALSEGYGGKALPLADLDFIASSQAKRASFAYLQQVDIPQVLPAVSKNGKMLSILPSFKSIKEVAL